MYPDERSLVNRLNGMPFSLLGVNSDKNRDELRTVMDKEGITWRSWWDGGKVGGPIATLYRVQVWPTTYVLDHHGVIRYKNVRGEEMDRAINTLLEELAQDPEAQVSEPPRSPTRKRHADRSNGTRQAPSVDRPSTP